MKIKELEINNFKFHKKSCFNANSKNIILFGENGSGKSSLYYALHTIHKILIQDNDCDFCKKLDHNNPNENLCNHNEKDDAVLNLTFDNGGSIKISKDGIDNLSIIDVTSAKFMHFINHNKLLKILEGNFYDILKKYFVEKFDLFSELNIEVNEFKNDSSKINTEDINKKLMDSLNKLENLINDGLNKIQGDLKISFEIEEIFLIEIPADGRAILNEPKINIKINEFKDFKFRINEARLKLISIMMFFVSIKEEKLPQDNPNILKLIVLDDILLSMDMVNRTKIIDYILDNFSDYQVFIFTHDIFFLNHLQKRIMHHCKKEQICQTDWNLIFMYAVNNDNNVLFNYSDNSFLEKAIKQLNECKLDECGNNLRKELESMVCKMQIDFCIGRDGKLHNMMNNFLELQYKSIFLEPHKLILDIKNKLNVNNPNESKINDIICQQEKNLQGINKLLHNLIWHKDIVGNASSHAAISPQFQNDFSNAIKDIEDIKNYLK
ncbi:hypothetical protein [uncultured Campylobacter sp.]|uniref:hypothetical protein n=1 Tax=uncultured Campylobacter sp. TaxID=218934 RepID=UPI00262DBAA2|nr:hypothetical protein [uncultured Campylobacter sp.]